jgi:hypothetical protein
MLVAVRSIVVGGEIRTAGAGGEAGSGGGEGRCESSRDPGSGCEACGGCADHRYALCPGQGPCGSAGTDCCERACCYYYCGGNGGRGGPGGHGAGGGVLLRAPAVEITGTIDARGGYGGAGNGGTVKVRHRGPPPSVAGVAACRTDVRAF